MKMVNSLSGTEPADKENVINKALGVLAENGFYALNVFLLSCNKKAYGEKVFDTILEMLADDHIGILKKNKKKRIEALDDLRGITNNLPKLILARSVTEQALTFARYHCKARG